MKKRLPFYLLILILAGFYFLTDPLERHISQKSYLMIEESIRRSAVQCYALEGAYPNDLEYLKEHYGVSYDPRHYVVEYTYLASNLMPDITVLPVS